METTVLNLENSIERICRDSYPHEWDENHITYQLMKELRTHFSFHRIQFDNWFKIVRWESYKNRGKQETSYGDIALIVNIQFSSGETLKGIALLEAKRSFDSGNFDSANLSQLQRLKDNAPYAHLLLYTHYRESLYLKFPDDATWPSHMWVSPLNTANQLLPQITSDNFKILRTAFPFAMFLTSRIFWGLDLDFREDLYDDIAKGINKKLEPSFVGVVNVFYENQRPLEVVLPDKWERI